MNPIEEIKRKLDVVEFIGSHITLKKAGRNFKANCPFHQEKSASFVVSPERQIWHCFGACQEGGDVIRFLMKWENIPFVEALQELAKRTGVKLDTFDIQDSQWKKKEALIRVNNSAKDFYHYILTQSAIGKKAREYLAARNINEKIIETFQLGYAPQSWDSLIKFLIKKSFAQADLKDTGLTVTGKNNSLYDRFRGRIMFPINDTRGNNIGFSGRVLVEEDSKDGAKYVNTPETPLYHKRESLFGIHLAKDAIKKEGNVFLVEGEFDAISMYQSGVKNVVAIKAVYEDDEIMII
ncbi:MAG: DNA primase, partial [Patescibacteria group bacterium]